MTASCAGPEPEPVAAETESLVTAFPTGSFVIPMGTNFQNTGTLRAFGLVYQLLRNGVTVHWAILTGKAAGATDFTITAPATIANRESGAAMAVPAVYRGGSFIVSGADRAAALPIITAWLASDTVTVVHDVTGTFSADIARTLTAAPSIAVFQDGNEDIAFTNLNAAGITDSTGAMWGPTSVDLVSDVELAGPTTTSHTDGALFRADGSPAYCHVTSMHWEPTGPAAARVPEVVAEVRAFLDSARAVHAFMECHAMATFENDATSGRFLTTTGIRTDEPAVGTPLTVSFADSPFNQFDGMLQPDGGSVQSIAPVTGGAFRPFTRTLIADGMGDVLWATARLNGDATNGQITYLGGHNYSVTTPITTNPQTNGVRLFLDSLFESDCAGTAAAPMVSIVASSPATSPTTTYTVSFAYTNTGMGFADSAVLRTTLPAGATFVSATGGGALMAGDVVWNLGNLAPGATATVTMTITVPGDGSYSHVATMRYLQSLTPRTATSNTTTTVVSTVPPDTTIVTSEPNPTNDPTGDFVFSSTIPGSVYECSIDGGAFAACTETFSTSALAEGSHTIAVRARVPGGMTDPTPATYTWVVDTTAPDTMIVTSEPNPTGDRSGDFVFASPDATATFECSIDGGAFTACTATFSTADLADGSHTITVRAVDPAGNVDPTPATYTWLIDTRNFVTVALPAEGSTTSDSTPVISGTGVPGAMVAVTVDGTAVGTATVAADGTWSVTPTTPLAEGPHTATATATSSSGLTATDSNAFVVDSMTVVDVRQPAMGSTVGTPRPEISGTSEPGNDVEISIDGAVVATVLTDADGNWTYTPTTDLSDGMHNVSVEATDGVGNTATDTTAFTVAASAPSIEIRSPVDGSTTSDATPTISGRTDPGLMVRVTVDGAVVGTVTADASGNWSIDVTTALTSGDHRAEASVTDAVGRSATDSSNFTVDATAPDVAIVAPADGARTADTTPTLSGTADAGATVEVFVDGVLIGTTTAAADGTWSVTPTTPLAEGPHAARAVATDAAGNAATDGSGFIVDTSTTVAITAPADGSTIGTPRPTLRGTAEPGAMVEVTVDGTVIGTVTAAADGSWSLRVPTEVAAGMHDVSVEATDAVGNTATDTSTFTFDPALLDTDGDGLLDVDECPSMPCRDTDMDGNPDFDDPDDDGDGLPTTDEAPGGTPRDSDMDGMPDHLDPDDDNDGVPTAEESPGGMTRDTDMDGRPDHLDPDDDNDTIPTIEEAPGTMRPDTDGDGRPNFIDPDDDDDTIPTARERADGMMHGNDVDGDGDPNWLDTNADGVMAGDEMEGTGDTDGDGVPDYLDPDGAPVPDAGMGGRDAGPGNADAGAADAGGPAPDAGPTVGGFAGGACGCTVAGNRSEGGALAALGLLGLALALSRRKRATR